MAMRFRLLTVLVQLIRHTVEAYFLEGDHQDHHFRHLVDHVEQDLLSSAHPEDLSILEFSLEDLLLLLLHLIQAQLQQLPRDLRRNVGYHHPALRRAALKAHRSRAGSGNSPLGVA